MTRGPGQVRRHFGLVAAGGTRYLAAMHRIPRGLPIVVGAALLSALWGSAAQAAQVVVLDETWVHAPDIADSHYRVDPRPGTPDNWVSPVDYSQGKAYLYLEVHSKPTAQPTRFQVCFEANPTYGCTEQSPIYTEVGVYEWESDFAGFWSPPGEFVDWSLGVNKIACILKDTMNNKPSADNVGPEMAALYMPTEVRLVVTIVEPGGIYEPPTPTGEGTSSSGGDESSGGVSTTGSGESTGTGPEEPTTSTSMDPTSTTGSTGSEGGASTSGSSSSSSSTTTASSDDAGTDDTAAGCACRSSSGHAPTGLLWTGLLLGLFRRSRVSARGTC